MNKNAIKKFAIEAIMMKRACSMFMNLQEEKDSRNSSYSKRKQLA